ncbi:Cadherin EGF LAG seven-pass G-type receptor 1 [Microtus ochrogaster]|uniref:Cadherin EGF LAG seven-pass G-type receptor 1 n=1 Tax=Microtus ochrogaster TaxID=79684 RepID=A0A8J6GLJ9_MICOH|nr:Cadherin EGF LAG seven-pass G-type receptor 1 [Microtus ochrogaster]
MENYYKPPAQDACLPCDCFPHGSHSRACDMDTGQCACKPGVIGRQCNRCDNPFAEVTSLGCEGNAVRHCSGEKGWLPPELFNCTSGSFVDLKAMNEKLSRNETRMDGDRSLRLAKALRNATQRNGTLFGNDVRTAYQLLARILQHESHQQGFDLAATREANFHEDVVQTGSALLAPATQASWEQIQRSEGGAAQLLRHFEAYFSNVARNVKRTYLRPFIIITANMKSPTHGEVLPLKIITYAALSLSLVALLVAFVLLSLVRTLRSNLHSIHKNLIGALFFSQLIFLVGINQTENPFLCTVVAILLHYASMSTFAWTLVENLHVYRMLTEVRNIDTGPMRFYHVVGWGIPAIVTGKDTLGSSVRGYGNPDFCWLSLQDSLIWSFAGPVGMVIIINTVIFVLSAKVACQRKRHYYERKGVVSLLRTAFLLLLLVSATWLLGLLAVNSDTLSFHYLFAAFSCLQGLFVLLFHCVTHREVRKHLRAVLAGKKLHLDDSAATRATLLTRSLNCNNTYSEGPDMLRTALGESTASLDSPDSDSDSELSLDEHSSSYASSHSSDSEDDGGDAEDKWNPAGGPIHSTPKADALANHVQAGWPDESLAGSDSEELDAEPHLKVETKVSVELHRQAQGNHCGDRPPDLESGVLAKPVAVLSSQPQEQRKGILKNKVTYPPPLPEQPLKCRLREKLADCEQSPSSSRTSSLGSGDGVRATDCVITIKTPRREPGREHLNGVAMNVCTGSAQANGSDSE